jgi:hypothetical protein
MSEIFLMSSVSTRRIQRFSVFLVTIGLAVGALAQERLVREKAGVDELREVLEVPAETSDDEIRQAFGEFLAARESAYQQRKRAEATTVNDAVGSVSAVARCAEGYVSSHRIMRSADDVVIASERRTDCDETGCKAVQADARRESPAPFSLSVSVSCAG